MEFICFQLFLPILIATFQTPIYATETKDFYSSISGMEKLLAVEWRLLDNLKYYVDQELARHQLINSTLTDFENANEDALTNSEEYFASPINVFKVIKRSVVDFRDLQQYILELHNEEKYGESVTTIESSERLPLAQLDDLKGAALGLGRLQKTYKLNISELAEGRILGYQYDSSMGVGDLFEIGKQLYEVKRYQQAFEWLSSAWKRFETQMGDEFDFVDEITLLELLSSAAYGAEKLKEARDVVEEILRIDPFNEDARDNLETAKKQILAKTNSRKYLELRSGTKMAKPKTWELYERTCRGDLQQTPAEKRPLRCMYVTNGVPFLTIAPFKFEQLSLDPYIVYYHDVIYDKEIKQTIETAKFDMGRSTIGDGGTSNASPFRTSKNSWLEIEEHEFLHNFEQRLVDITQLDLETAEKLQVANYGIGGHYGPHYDFSTEPFETFGEWSGNRMATALFYISDVEHGGATAFPLLKLAVQPIKGSLLFWYNLYNSSDPDPRTMHASCPVLKGSKWILNEWIHERGQEFNRPCVL